MGTAPVLHHPAAEASSTRTGPVGSRSFIPASLHRVWAHFLTSSRQRCYRFAVRFTLFDRCVLRPASLRLVSSRRVRSPTRLGPIGLLIVMILTGLLLPLPGALSTDTGSPESGARSLSHLVYEYLGTEDPDRASLLLADMLRDPGADLETVGMMIKEGRPYGMEPIGVQPGLPVRVRDHNYRYGLFVPPSYRPTKDYALVVCLHGAGFTGDTYLERWQARLGDGYILACPTLVQGAWWTRQAEELVLATIRAVQARYRIDPDRIFLTGMSNGGIGAWIIGSHHAPLFAGLAPMASGLDDVLFPFLENLRHTPTYLIHGLKDQVMPVELSRSIVRELTRLGYEFVYREHDRVHSIAGGHYFPREELPELVAWFEAHHRDPFPRKVTVVRDATHLTAFGWVRS